MKTLQVKVGEKTFEYDVKAASQVVGLDGKIRWTFEAVDSEGKGRRAGSTGRVMYWRVGMYCTRFVLLLGLASAVDLMVRRFVVGEGTQGSVLSLLLVHMMFKIGEAATTILSENFIEDFIATPLLRRMTVQSLKR